jgi:hypothetical protein
LNEKKKKHALLDYKNRTQHLFLEGFGTERSGYLGWGAELSSKKFSEADGAW